jgi:hypothetical protein
MLLHWAGGRMTRLPAITVDENVASGPEPRDSLTGPSGGYGKASPHATIRPYGPPEPFPDKGVVKTRLLGPMGTQGVPDFELLEVIGEGGMGVVYTARQTALDRVIAIKRIRPGHHNLADQRRFLAEAAVTGRLDHPNIVPIHDLGIDQDGIPFYAMKHVRGRPWSELLREKTQEENLDILLRVGDTVAFAHARGVIHRDLKPENVMLGDFGELLVMDWGLAVAVEDLRRERHAQPVACGTPAYMAPEMAVDDHQRIGTTSDIYLLGAILFEIVAGTAPHPGADVSSSLLAAAKNLIVPSGQTGELAEIALRAMAKEPSERQATVQDFQAAIRAYQSHAQSLELSSRAARFMSQASRERGYDAFARAQYAFEDALELWPDNAFARAGARHARLAYAERARAAGDLDLAASLLSASDADHVLLLRQVEAVRHMRHHRQRRIRVLTWVSYGLLVLVIASLETGLLLVQAERDLVLRVTHERDQAEARLAKDETERQRAWTTVLEEGFESNSVPEATRVVRGEWTARNDVLIAKAEGVSVLLLAVPATEALRLQFDLLATHHLSVHLGVAEANVPERLEDSGQVVILDRQCLMVQHGQVLAAVPMPESVRGLSQRVLIGRLGLQVRVLVNGQQLMQHLFAPESVPVLRPRLVITAEKDTTIDNLRVERLTIPAGTEKK